ncbi:MAG: hypothetical protein R3B67_00135 [Phycisphaerales bacterium]
MEIKDAVESYGFETVITSIEHPNGTSRLGEASDLLELTGDQLVINVQGDEPEIEPEVIDAAAQAGARIDGFGAGTVVTRIYTDADFQNPNIVKAVLGEDEGEIRPAIYFSRSPVPYPRNMPEIRRFAMSGSTLTASMLSRVPEAQANLPRINRIARAAPLACTGYRVQAAIVESSHRHRHPGAIPGLRGPLPQKNPSI